VATTDSTTIPDPSPEPQAGGSPAFGTATLSPARLFYWCVRRELWENRFLYIVLLIVAGVTLFGFAIGAAHLPHTRLGGSASANHVAVTPLNFAVFALMLTYVIVTLSYCLGALHNERSDRGILFWKSLPVSDATTVIAKASIPIVILPLITFVVLVVTQGIMLVAGHVALLDNGAGGAASWVRVPIFPLWGAMLYHLLTVHALYYAPIYGWLLLVSAWARRAPILWATLPVAAVLIIEKLVFNSSAFAHMLLSRLGGGPGAIEYPPPGNMPIEAPTLANFGAFLASPGLWIGLVVCALFLAAAVRVRRYQGPI
jgi:ABC-2 type transport system permease protein